MSATLSTNLSALLAAGLAAGAVVLLLPPRPGARLAAVAPSARSGPDGARTASSAADSAPGVWVAGPVSLWGASLLAGLGVVLLVGGWTGVAAGAAAAVAALLMLRRLEPRAARLRRERLGADLPLAVDLLAGCLLAGRPPTAALDSVCSAVGGPLAADLGPVTARLRLGADPVTVWREVGGRTDALAVLGRAMARSLHSGAPMADGMTLLAADLRRRRREEAERRARGVGVRAAAPLGICFLPAFVLVGIVPAVVGAFTAMRWG
jgi:Flp pilus assembly protein TadB